MSTPIASAHASSSSSASRAALAVVADVPSTATALAAASTAPGIRPSRSSTCLETESGVSRRRCGTSASVPPMPSAASAVSRPRSSSGLPPVSSWQAARNAADGSPPSSAATSRATPAALSAAGRTVSTPGSAASAAVSALSWTVADRGSRTVSSQQHAQVIRAAAPGGRGTAGTAGPPTAGRRWPAAAAPAARCPRSASTGRAGPRRRPRRAAALAGSAPAPPAWPRPRPRPAGRTAQFAVEQLRDDAPGVAVLVFGGPRGQDRHPGGGRAVARVRQQPRLPDPGGAFHEEHRPDPEQPRRSRR